MKLRARSDRGSLALEPDTYGRSVLGHPLEVWRPSGVCRTLVFASIHGNEGETTAALSLALRHLSEPSPHCAVVLAANPDGLLRGTRGNARGVELNRNFPSSDWRAGPIMHRETMDDPRDVELSPGDAPGSEPETRALMALIEELEPEVVVALHAPLACIDDPNETELGTWIAQRTGMPLVPDVGYPTPGSFGTWARERGLPVVTYEFPLITPDAAVREHVPVLVDILTRDG
ncbi:MAG: murein tripeptide amidase MpaA [Gemmatimonadota bacterium]|jgi:protein MpaA